MRYIELAKAYYEGDESKNINENLEKCEYYLQKALEQEPNNAEIYYLFGLLYFENEEFIDYNKAVINFEKAYKLGNKDSALNLAFLYQDMIENASDNSIENYINALKWYLKYGDENYYDDVLKLLKKISKFYFSNNENLEHGIKALKDLTYKTKAKKFLTDLYNVIDALLARYVDTIPNNFQRLEDYDSAIHNLEKYYKNQRARIKIEELKSSKKRFLIFGIKTVDDALSMLDKSLEYEFDESDKNNIYRFLIISYIKGINGVSLDVKEALKYKNKYSWNTYFLDSYLEDIIRDLISNENLELAATLTIEFESAELKYRYKNLIDEINFGNQFVIAQKKALEGDKDSTFLLAKLYEQGRGTEADCDRAFSIYVEIFKKYLDLLAFDGALRCCKKTNNEHVSTMKEFYDICSKNNIKLSAYALSRRREFFPIIMLYGKERIPLIDYTSDNPCDFSYVDNPKWITCLKEELERRKITKLIHVTSKKNIPTILKYGLLSRESIAMIGIIDEFAITDKNRVDSYLNAINVSITGPNNKMFTIKINDGILKDPYVIEIDARILLNKDMRFIYCSGNASTFIKKDVNKGWLFKDFLKMFGNRYLCDDGIYRTRDELNLRDNETTDEQAEILVEGCIDPAYFLGSPIPLDEWKKRNHSNRKHFYGAKIDFYF